MHLSVQVEFLLDCNWCMARSKKNNFPIVKAVCDLKFSIHCCKQPKRTLHCSLSYLVMSYSL